MDFLNIKCNIPNKCLTSKRSLTPLTRGGSRGAATSKMESFVIIVNGCKPLTIITKRSILDVAAALDPPLTDRIQYAKYNIQLLEAE